MVSETITATRKRIILGLLETDPRLVKWLKGILKVYA